jgi:hypothetical protein
MLLAICFILGGLARAFVGTGYLSRWAVYPFIALICAFIGLYNVTDNIFAVCWAALIACHLGLGWTKWEKWKWMLGRFGLPALVLTVPLLYLGYISMASAGIYVVLSLLAGYLYPHREKVFQLLRLNKINYSWVDSARLAEFVAGVAVFGGLSIL